MSQPPYPHDPYGNPQQYPAASQQPVPYAVPNYYGGQYVVRSPRPGSVTSVAIIGIILASLTLLCSAPSIFLNAAMLKNGRNPIAPHLLPMEHSVVVLSVFQTLGNTIMALIMLIGCIGALRLSAWARRIMIPWSYAMLGWAVFITICTGVWINPAGRNAIPHHMRQMNQATQAMQETIQNITLGVLFVVMCTVPVCVLIFWTRPEVKAAFGEMIPTAGLAPTPPSSPAQ